MLEYRVCVADDSDESVAVLTEGLRQNNYEAIAAHSGEEALRICESGDIDLILLDVCMPDIDGYEVCRRLKESPKTRDIVVIFVTVRGAQEDISHGYSLGAADYITKPYNLPMVMIRVDAAMRSKETREKLKIEYDFLHDTAYTDSLTGLRNRRYLMERLQEEVEKAHRYNFPVSCVVFDVDQIRALDEELGPVSVDDLLVEIALTIRHYSRTFDVVARFDGTQFAAVLPHTDTEQAKCYANNILNEVNSTIFSDPSFPTEAELSVGIVTCRNGTASSAEQVMGEAMRGLLQARSQQVPERMYARDI